MKLYAYLVFFAILLHNCKAFQPTHRHHRSTAQHNLDSYRNSATSISYSNSTTDTIAGYTRTASFADRMRNILLTEQKEVASSRPTSSRRKVLVQPAQTHQVQTVTTLSEFQKIVNDNGKKQKLVTAVRWYAPWCRACRAVEPLYYRMSKTTPTNRAQFVDVPAMEDNRDLHAGFGIPKVPYGHIYHPKYGLVEELALNRKTAKDYYAILQSYIDMSCELPSEIDPETGIYEAPYQRLT